MNIKIILIISILLPVLISTIVISSSAYSQESATQGSLVSSEPKPGLLLEKILSSASLTNIQIISWVEGIKITEVMVGDTDITFTVENTLPNKESKQNPITITVLKIPGSTLKDMLGLLGSVDKLRANNTSMPETAMIGQLIELFGSNSTPESTLQSLVQIGLTTEMGLVHIVGENWNKPRTVSTALVDFPTLMGMADRPETDDRANFVTIIITPYVGKTSIGSVPLR